MQLYNNGGQFANYKKDKFVVPRSNFAILICNFGGQQSLLNRSLYLSNQKGNTEDETRSLASPSAVNDAV
jgi:hypothetical protein